MDIILKLSLFNFEAVFLCPIVILVLSLSKPLKLPISPDFSILLLSAVHIVSAFPSDVISTSLMKDIVFLQGCYTTWRTWKSQGI